MKSFLPYRALAMFLGGLLAACVGAGSLRAQTGSAIETVGGPLRQSVFENEWNLRFPRVANTGSGDRQLRVVYTAGGPQLAQGRFTATLPVKAGTARVFTLPVRPQALPELGRQAGRVTLEETYDLYDDQTGQRLQHYVPSNVTRLKAGSAILFSGLLEEGMRYSYLSDLPGRELGEAVVTFVVPGDLPDRWYGYLGMRLVMLGGFEPSLVRPGQWEALLQWVRSGGVLVLTGSTRTESILDDELAAAAGVVGRGFHAVSSLAVPALKLGGPVPLAPSMPMVELCLQEAEVVWEANGLPLLTRHALGSGYVFTLAVPVGAMESPQLHPLWKPVDLAAGTLPTIRNDRSFVEAATGLGQLTVSGHALAAPEILRQIAGHRAPHRIVPMTILALFAAATLAAGLLLRRRRRGERLWLVLVPAAIALAAGIFFYGRSQTQGERFSFVGLVTGMGDGDALVQEAVAYYSGPGGGTVTFGAGGPGGTLRSLATGGAGTADAAQTDYLDGLCVSMDSLPPATTRSMLVQAAMPQGGIESELTFGPGGLTGTLTNRMGADLSDAVICTNRATYRLGQLPEGRAVAATINDALRLGRDDYTGKDVKAPADHLRSALLAQVAGQGPHVSDQPVVIGHMDRSSLEPLRGRRIPRQGWTVVAWPLKLKRPLPGTRVQIPSAFVSKSYSTAVFYDIFREQYPASHLPTEVLVSAAPPTVVGPLKDARAALQMVVRASGFRLTVSGVAGGSTTPGGSQTEIRQIDNPSGVYEIAVPQAGRFAAANGHVVLSIKMSPLKAPPAEAAADVVNTAQWKFESVEISLEGVSQ